MMNKRWLSLYVENDVGVLAKITGLFSGKAYNLDSLTVGPTEDPTVSRMTIGLMSDDSTFEQVKKQLNRCVEVIKVVDLTEIPTARKEIMLIRVNHCSAHDKAELFRLAQIYRLRIAAYQKTSVLLESVQSQESNQIILQNLRSMFDDIHVVRGGTVAMELDAP